MKKTTQTYAADRSFIFIDPRTPAIQLRGTRAVSIERKFQQWAIGTEGQTEPGTGENSTQFLPLNKGEESTPSISFPRTLSPPLTSAICSRRSVLSSRLCPREFSSSGWKNHRQPGASLKAEHRPLRGATWRLFFDPHHRVSTLYDHRSILSRIAIKVTRDNI